MHFELSLKHKALWCGLALKSFINPLSSDSQFKVWRDDMILKTIYLLNEFGILPPLMGPLKPNCGLGKPGQMLRFRGKWEELSRSCCIEAPAVIAISHRCSACPCFCLSPQWLIATVTGPCVGRAQGWCRCQWQLDPVKRCRLRWCLCLPGTSPTPE